MCICMAYIHVPVSACAHACHVYVCMWRTEVNVSCRPYFHTGFLAMNLELIDSRLVGQ